MTGGRVVVLAVVAAVGLVLGGMAALALDPEPEPEPVIAAVPVAKEVPAPPAERVLLVWSSGGLPEGFAERVAGAPLVTRSTVVEGGLVELASSWDAGGRAVDLPGPGLVVPLDVLGVDPATYPAFLPASSRATFAELAPGEALLGTTSAGLRRIGPGGFLQLADGSTVTVAGVVDDVLVAGAELVVPAYGLPAEDRYLLVAYDGDRAAVEQALRALAPDGTALRIRGPGEAPFLRHGDAVLPQAVIKERFGEFAYRREGGDLVLEPGWADGLLATEDLPLLGPMRCHQALLPALRGALAEIAERNLGYLVEETPGGCHASRLTAAEDSVSRHAWGVALDLADAPDPRVVEVLQRWGFAWGGEWLVPDPGHFEYVREPQSPAGRHQG